MENTKAPITEADLIPFIERVQKLVDEYWTSGGFTHSKSPLVSFTKGTRYTRITKLERDKDGNAALRGSVYCFVDMTNGDILKAASYKAPQKNGVRGNLHDPNHMDCLNWHGTKYLR